MNMIEIELTGIEETKWATDKKRLKGEHAFYSEKAVIFIFPPDFQERAGQYSFPFSIKLPSTLPPSIAYFNPNICGS